MADIVTMGGERMSGTGITTTKNATILQVEGGRNTVVVFVDGKGSLRLSAGSGGASLTVREGKQLLQALGEAVQEIDLFGAEMRG